MNHAAHLKTHHSALRTSAIVFIKQSKHRFVIPAVALCITAASGRAATIIYTFDTPTAAMNGSNTGQTATQAATTNNFGNGILASTYSATSPVGGIAVAGGQMRALHKVDTDTHTFTITVPNLVGQNVNLTSLSFTYGNAGGDTSPANFTVSSNRAGGTITPNTATHPTGMGTYNANMALAGTFTGINNSSITFTLLDSAGGNNNTTSNYTFIDNVTLTGTMIPESSVALLGSLGMLAVLRRRRY